MSGALSDTLPGEVQEYGVAVVGSVDLSSFVVNGSVWLYQGVDRRVVLGIVDAVGLSLEIVLERDARRREVF